MSANTTSGENGTTAHAASAGANVKHRRKDEQKLVGPAGNDDFFHHRLDRISDRLRPAAQPWYAKESDPVGSDTQLHEADDLPFRKRKIGDREHQRQYDGHDQQHVLRHEEQGRPPTGPKNSPNNCCAYSIKSSWSIPSQSFDGDFPEHSAQRRSQWMRRGDAYTVGRKLVVLHRSEVRFTFACFSLTLCPGPMPSLSIKWAGIHATGSAASRVRCKDSARRTMGSAW